MRETAARPYSNLIEAPCFAAPSADAAEIRQLASEQCGIVRCGDGLYRAVERLEEHDLQASPPTRESAALRNIHHSKDSGVRFQ